MGNLDRGLAASTGYRRFIPILIGGERRWSMIKLGPSELADRDVDADLNFPTVRSDAQIAAEFLDRRLAMHMLSIEYPSGARQFRNSIAFG